MSLEAPAPGSPDPPSPAPVGLRRDEILEELAKLQRKRSGWGSALLLLAVSLLVFLGAGAALWSWGYILVLIPALLVHEAGHYAAMRLFGYANVRMFFIPFFGAAVSGRNFNVPAWKKAVVSLMGPVPGIALAGGVGIIGVILHEPALMRAAMVTLFLNGFNLLPILPLDGGWIVHTVLFSRHALLDVAFRVLAALSLAGIGALARDGLLVFLGVLMLIGVPTAYRLARVTRTLRERAVPALSPDDQTVPDETAAMIVDELERSATISAAPKIVAKQALEVFESLNARPPGWGASLALLGVYLASGLVAVALVVGLVVALGPGFTPR